ncbi:MAG: class D sortase [Actinomycetia bacterium]|nr:class D sortase [Actinomycetes bacterium]
MRDTRRLGGALLGLGLFALGAPLWARGWTWAQQARLAVAARPLAAVRTTVERARPGLPAAAPLLPPPPSGTVVAQLSIPSLFVDAAVVAGTDPFALSTAPGWVRTTALPGENGTAVIAAHNATFFRHLDRLRPGQRIAVTTRQGRFVFAVVGARVVRAGTPLVNSRRPTLALVACYPLDALYLTPWRYVVTARLVQSELMAAVLKPPAASWPYVAAVPAALARRYDLWLSGNRLPMGTLTYRGPRTPAAFRFEGTDLPYDVVAEALRLFFAVRDAAATSDTADYARMTAGQVPLPPFWGHPLSVVGGADVAITLDAAGRPTAVDVVLHEARWGTGRAARVDFRVAVEGTALRVAAITPA